MNKVYDVVIVGGGPAGLTAGIYCARAGLSTLIVERHSIGGKITSSPEVKNIPGFASISGADFADNIFEQAEDAGVEFAVDEIYNITFEYPHYVSASNDELYRSKTIILAVGTENRKLSVPGESELIGDRIHYCVTCDGPFYQDQIVAVIGGGNSAVTEAIELSKICKQVIMVQNLLTLTAEKALLDKLETCKNVNVITDATVQRFDFDNDVVRMQLMNQSSGVVWDLDVDGVFEAIGMIPDNERFSNIAALSDNKYIKGGISSGVYAAGDCVYGNISQVVTACASGAEAALKVIRHLS